MTRCNVLLVAAAAAARALPGAAVSCPAPRSRLGHGPGRRPRRGCGSRCSHHARRRAVRRSCVPARAPGRARCPRPQSESAAAPQPDPERPAPGNATRSGAAAAGGGASNSTGDALVTRVSRLLRALPTLKAAVVVACAVAALLLGCLLLRVFRSGRRLKKTRKYDIITTPAERVEMAPLNEEDDEDEDATVFDIKYRYGTGTEASSGPEGIGVVQRSPLKH
ncbi:hypothetical protein MC885_020867 [Smutsia gigantea]|nr:hypothetical protein MC885_020867 [Smutsia gigantea]